MARRAAIIKAGLRFLPNAMESAGKVLIVDDDLQVRTMLCDYLSSHGYQVSQADSGGSMRAAFEQASPDVVLLDLNLPGEDGLTLARYLREHYDVGIIIVTAAGDVIDRIVGLEVGADDYIAKPFDPRELRARVKSLMRRRHAHHASTGVGVPDKRRIPIGACILDLQTHQLFQAGGSEIPLTAMEFDLLRVFAEHPHEVLTRDQLLTLTRNREWEPFDRSIDIRIARLRRKIEANPDNPRVIKTVRGSGYMFLPGEATGRAG
jgi:two-component system OmpR family response regulator